MTTPALPRERVVAARTAVFVVFALAGVAFATWASRIADAKAVLDLTAGQLGLTLFAMSAGSLLAMPSTGRFADRFGVVTTIRAGMLIGVVGFAVVGAGVDLAESRAVVAAGPHRAEELDLHALSLPPPHRVAVRRPGGVLDMSSQPFGPHRR